MSYNVINHGDRLEKEAANLIHQNFPNYELVWQSYIGNIGNNSMASMPGYPYESKRKNFAENSYTVLESVYLIDHILNDPIFKSPISNFGSYIDFNKAFITVFALLGRMHDTVLKASDCLKYDNRQFRESIIKFYDARCIVMHGKKVPIIFDDLGFPKIPFLKTRIIDGIAWEDNNSNWREIKNMETDYVIDKLTEFNHDLLQIINNEYAVFFDIIMQELKSIPTSLKFEHYPPEYFDIAPNVADVSGSTGAVDVYGFNELARKQNRR